MSTTLDAAVRGTTTRGATGTLPAPQLTGAEADSLEEEVERRVAAHAVGRHAHAPAGPAGSVGPFGPASEPQREAAWPRRAVRAVVRAWHGAMEREAGLDAERDEVRRRLLTDQPRIW